MKLVGYLENIVLSSSISIGKDSNLWFLVCQIFFYFLFWKGNLCGIKEEFYIVYEININKKYYVVF